MRLVSCVASVACGLAVLACGSDSHGSLAIRTATPAPAVTAAPPALGSLIFERRATRTSGLYAADIGSGSLTNLTHNSATDWLGHFSPDGSHVAFSSMRAGESDIYVMNPDGSDMRDLTNTPDKDESFVSWSPDGAKMLYGLFSEVTGEYWTMASDGSDKRIIMPQCNGCGIDDWAPDGRVSSWVTETTPPPT